ncbi:MAG: VWA domain-containing protein [Gammaproteobacteria bacterium]|nr:VWA domain-containing protein [Gammaproteobacteria bacterium]
MIDFAWPWIFLLLPLPVLVRVVLPPAERPVEAALHMPFLEDLRGGSQGLLDGASKHRWFRWAALSAWILLVTSGARPQWLGEAVDLPMSGRDLMLAVDLSGSMQERDFVVEGRTVNRLAATKRVVGDFIERRRGDRVGLILFGDRAYLQAPLTFDLETVRTLLDEAVIGLAGKQTAIGDAIGLAIKRLRERPAGNRILILLTDGANTAGEIRPEKAAQLAAQSGLKIYTIGVGADRMTVNSLFGPQEINPSRDLNEAALRAIAEATGGRYFRAKETGELTRIYRLLDEMEPVEQDPRRFRPVVALYPWPLGLALLLAGLLLAASLREDGT